MDYNPRQITQMRWRDVKEIEKFKFITGSFDFADEVLEKASTTKPYSKIVDIMKESAAIKKNFGIVLHDSPDVLQVYIGDCVEYHMYLFVLAINNITEVDLAYDPQTDKLTITSESEELMSTDNVKTLFGEQSIIGQGNIDLYNHFLTVTASDNTKLYINYPSSNNLECDSLQDLTKMTKAKNGTKIGFGNTYINYNGSIWQTANSTAITAVSDVVTTL